MISSDRPRLVLFLCVVGLPVLVSSAARPGSSEQTRSPGPALVTVDFQALDRNGAPVVDLKPEEILLKVGGRVREVVALELMRAGGEAPPNPVAGDRPPEPFTTNVLPSSGRTVMLVVDDDSVPPGQEGPTRDALTQLVAALTPEDRVGVLTPRGGGLSVSPTVRHDQVLAAIAELRGKGTASESSADAVCRTSLVQTALLGLFEGAAPSAPTVVVLASTGLSAPATTTLSAIGNARSGVSSGQSQRCEFTSADVDALATAAAASRGHMYALDVGRGTEQSVGMENFASLTGNPLIRLSGDTRNSMKRIADATSAYYLAAFEATGQERTGASQRLVLSVSREGVGIKAAPSVVIPKPAADRAKAARPKVREMLSAPKVYRDLPLRATVYTSRLSPDGKLRVVCVFDSSDSAAQLSEAGAAVFDGAGKPWAQWTGLPADLKSRPAMAMLTAPGPGTYRLRLAVVDATGAAGTVDEQVRVAAPTPGTPTVSAMILGTKGAAGFAPRLLFADEPVAIAMVEVYGVAKASAVTATFEFAAAGDGPALASMAGSVQSPREDLRVAFSGFPIDQMPAGDVVMRALIAVDGKPLPARPFRTMRKVER